MNDLVLQKETKHVIVVFPVTAIQKYTAVIRIQYFA